MPPSGRSTRAGPASSSSRSLPSSQAPSSDAMIPDVLMAQPAGSAAPARLSTTLRSTTSTLEITSVLVPSEKVSVAAACGAAAVMALAPPDTARLTGAMPREPVPSVHAATTRVVAITQNAVTGFRIVPPGQSETVASVGARALLMPRRVRRGRAWNRVRPAPLLAHNGAHSLVPRHGPRRLVQGGAGWMMLIEVRDHAAGS